MPCACGGTSCWRGSSSPGRTYVAWIDRAPVPVTQEEAGRAWAAQRQRRQERRQQAVVHHSAHQCLLNLLACLEQEEKGEGDAPARLLGEAAAGHCAELRGLPGITAWNNACLLGTRANC